MGSATFCGDAVQIPIIPWPSCRNRGIGGGGGPVAPGFRTDGNDSFSCADATRISRTRGIARRSQILWFCRHAQPARQQTPKRLSWSPINTCLVISSRIHTHTHTTHTHTSIDTTHIYTQTHTHNTSPHDRHQSHNTAIITHTLLSGTQQHMLSRSSRFPTHKFGNFYPCLKL